MADESESFWMTQRRQIHEAVQDALRLDPAFAEGTVSGWVLIAEVMTPGEDDYRLHFINRSSDATGESDLRPWTAHGWCAHLAHNPDLFTIYEDEDEEDQ